MEQQEMNKLYEDFKSIRIKMIEVFDNVNLKKSLTFKSNLVISYCDLFKKLVKIYLSKLAISNIIFSKQNYYNRIYLGGMFKLKNEYYKFSIYPPSKWGYVNIFQLEIMPLCKINPEYGDAKLYPIYRRTKRYSWTNDFDSFSRITLPKPAKCKPQDIVIVRNRYDSTTKIAKILNVNVSGYVFYKVQYLDLGKIVESYITEPRIKLVKNGI